MNVPSACMSVTMSVQTQMGVIHAPVLLATHGMDHSARSQVMLSHYILYSQRF